MWHAATLTLVAFRIALRRSGSAGVLRLGCVWARPGSAGRTGVTASVGLAAGLLRSVPTLARPGAAWPRRRYRRRSFLQRRVQSWPRASNDSSRSFVFWLGFPLRDPAIGLAWTVFGCAPGVWSGVLDRRALAARLLGPSPCGGRPARARRSSSCMTRDSCWRRCGTPGTILFTSLERLRRGDRGRGPPRPQRSRLVAWTVGCSAVCCAFDLRDFGYVAPWPSSRAGLIRLAMPRPLAWRRHSRLGSLAVVPSSRPAFFCARASTR
jgi:hypothetical protein